MNIFSMNSRFRNIIEPIDVRKWDMIKIHVLVFNMEI